MGAVNCDLTARRLQSQFRVLGPFLVEFACSRFVCGGSLLLRLPYALKTYMLGHLASANCELVQMFVVLWLCNKQLKVTLSSTQEAGWSRMLGP